MFLDHTQRRSTVGRTPLNEWSARRRDLYLTTHDTHNRQISMPPVGFEPTISEGERPQATGPLLAILSHMLPVYTFLSCGDRRNSEGFRKLHFYRTNFYTYSPEVVGRLNAESTWVHSIHPSIHPSTLTASSNYKANNPPPKQNQRLLVQF